MARASDESALDVFMSNLLASYGDLPMSVAIDNAKSINPEPFRGQCCRTFELDYPKCSNRWGNSSPGSFVPDHTIKTESYAIEKSSQLLPLPPPDDFSPCRWQGASPGERDNICSPTLPARKHDSDQQWGNPKRKALPKHLHDLPY